jgi:DNA-binding Lrp family transcriptional regulator
MVLSATTKGNEGPEMVHAYILVQTEVGKSSVVARAVADLPGVSSAEDVTGPYDVIARIEAASVEELGRLVIAKIQDVPHITRTTTCTVVHFSR